MVRVLHVVTSMGVGGIEVLLMNLYHHIDRSKVQFDFLLHRDEESKFEAEILAMGGRIFRVPPVNPLRHRRYLRALRAFFQEHRGYRIVHAHNNAFSMYVLREAKRAGVPVCIAHSHTANVSFDIKRSPFYYYCRKRILRYTDHAFACSKAAGQWLFGKGILTSPKFRVVHNAIDCDQFVFCPNTRAVVRESLELPEGPVFGHVGRFRPEKNHSFLLRLFASLRRQEPKASLLLVGDGPLMSQVQREAEELGLLGPVRFLGPRSDVAELLMAMDVFLLPSHFEGIPVTVIEAQASGLPCLISEGLSDDMWLTDLVHTVPLKEEDWVRMSLRVAAAADENGRQPYNGAVRAAGYHMADVALQLQEVYLSVGSGGEAAG